MDLTVSRLKSFEQLMALRTEWRELELESRATLPFTTWEWAITWWCHLRESKFGVADSLDVRCIRTRAGKLVGIAPMMITNRPSKGPFQFRQLQFFGADPNITELRGLLAIPDHLPDIFRALIDDVQASAAEWDWALISGVPNGSGYQTVIEQRFQRATWKPDTTDYLLPLPTTWDALRAGMRRNVKESLRKCYNSLKRDNLEFDFEVVHDGARVAETLDAFFRLHNARALQTGVVQHSDVFRAPEARRFLQAACKQLAGRGVLRIFVLRVQGQIAAIRVGFILRDTLYLYFSGYEPSLAKYSVMTTATAEAIKHAIEQGCAFVNLSPGTDVSKTRWSPQELVSREVLVVAPTVRGQLMHDLYLRGRTALNSTPALSLVRKVAQRGRTLGTCTAKVPAT